MPDRTATVAALSTHLPAEPLVRLVEGRGGLYACLGRGRDDLAARRLDRAYSRAITAGHMTWKTGDQLAIELLGLHPLLVWGAGWLRPMGPGSPSQPRSATDVPGIRTPSQRRECLRPER